MTIAKTEDTSSESSPKSRFDQLITDLKGSKISKSKLREEVFNILSDDATESPSKGRYYTFEYDPKFADNLKEWDEYPLIYVMEFKKNNLIGANIHYIRGTNSRLKALNNNCLLYTSPSPRDRRRADSVFFEIQESEVQILSTLPIEKFHYNR